MKNSTSLWEAEFHVAKFCSKNILYQQPVIIKFNEVIINNVTNI